MQFIFYLFAVVAITIGVVLVPVHANVQREVTIPVEAGISECFFQNISAGNVIDIEYQVIDGGHGDADISFVLYDTNGKIISSDYKKSDNIHRHEALLDGDYRFCFDNSFSMFNTKTVFFEIIVETDESGAPTADAWGPEILDGLSPEEFVDLKIQDIQESITRVHHNLNRVKQAQDIRRSVEARDRNMAEENNFRVGAWSMIQIVMMVIVGALQVFMLRSLFDTNNRSRNIWSKISFLK